jgi:hypothetical protein
MMDLFRFFLLGEKNYKEFQYLKILFCKQKKMLEIQHCTSMSQKLMEKEKKEG